MSLPLIPGSSAGELDSKNDIRKSPPKSDSDDIFAASGGLRSPSRFRIPLSAFPPDPQNPFDDPPRKRARKAKYTFVADLRSMVHGFGDVSNPYEETIDILDDIVVDYIAEIACNASMLNNKNKLDGKTKVSIRLTNLNPQPADEDIQPLLRKDKKKWTRAQHLLDTAIEIAQARASKDMDFPEE
eukprot:UC4_evm10s1211